MVRFTVLASGSRGNSTLVCGGQTRILVDAGLSCRELFRRMRLAGEDPATLDAIIVTHEHQDHINGLAVTARKLGIPVYFTEGTHRAWMRWLTPRRQMTYAQWLEQCRKQAAERRAEAEMVASESDADESGSEESGSEESGSEESGSGECGSGDCGAASNAAEPAVLEAMEAEAGASSASAESAPTATPCRAAEPTPKDDPTWLPSVEYFQSGEAFSIGDIGVSPFTISHDAADPVGFVFSAEGVRMAVATDLGYVSPNVKAQLKGVDLLLIESNHDLEMLRDGPYPWSVKQRVLSRVGHLSNEATGEFLESGYDGQAAYVILGHLSENNNLPELARLSAERALSCHASLLANKLLLAMQHEALGCLQF